MVMTAENIGHPIGNEVAPECHVVGADVLYATLTGGEDLQLAPGAVDQAARNFGARI